MNHIKTYDKYKNSGIEWIGDIPDDWRLVKTSRIFRNIKEIVGKKSISTERLALTLNGVVRRNKDDADGLQPEQFDGYQYLRKNQLVFKLIDLENINTSRVGLCSFDEGMVSPAYIVLKNANTDNRYYHYYFLSLWHNAIFNFLGSNGVRSALNAKDLLNIPIFDLKKEEQQQIADYLDKKCGEIDRVIETQKNIIEKLKEYKQSVITEAVTKGLDKSAPLKNSGIEWIGGIPEHWYLRKLKTIFNLRNEKVEYNGEEYIGLENIISNSGKYNLSDENIIDGISNKFYSGDVLFGKLRPYLAKATIVDFDGLCSSEFLVMQNYKGNNNFLLKTLLSYWFIDVVNSSTYGTKMPRASWEFISNMIIPFPSLNEQQQIADYLDNKCSEIDNAISEKQRLIEKLTEYKKSLIYECVTGKRKVVV